MKPSYVFAAGLALALALALSATPAEATPGAWCTHTRECSSGEACIADSPTSDRGHCVKIRVLQQQP